MPDEGLERSSRVLTVPSVQGQSAPNGGFTLRQEFDLDARINPLYRRANNKKYLVAGPGQSSEQHNAGQIEHFALTGIAAEMVR